MEEIQVEDGVLLFLREGQYFIPGMEKDVGEVTFFLAGKAVYYVRCTSDSFLGHVADRLCMDLRRLRELSFKITGQRKMAPLIFSRKLVLIPFIHLPSSNKHHRKGYVRLSSIRKWRPALLPNTCKIELHEAHILHLRLSVRHLVDYISKARLIRDYYANLFCPYVSEDKASYETQIETDFFDFEG